MEQLKAISSLRQWWDNNSFPVYIFFVTWIWLNIISYATLYYFPARSVSANWCIFPRNLFIEGWARWDSGWYLGIINDGYTNIANSEGQRDTVFFPLYPAVVRLLKLIIPNDVICGLIVSNVAFLAALIILYRLVISRLGIDIAKRCIILISVYPFSFFFRAMYTESIFLLLVLTAFYFGEKQKWLIASLFSAASGASRITGFLTIAGLIMLYIEKQGFDWRKVKHEIHWIIVGAAGPVSFMAFLAIKFGEPFAFAKNHLVPGRITESILEGSVSNFDAFLSATTLTTKFYPLLNLFYICLVPCTIVLLLFTYTKIGVAYSVWGFLSVIVSSFGWRSMGRYAVVIFPLFISAAIVLKKEIWFKTAVYLSIVLLTFFTLLFTHAYWVA